FPTHSELVQVEALSEDQLTAKMSMQHCMMMSHGGEFLARYRSLLKSYHEYVQSADSRLKDYEVMVAGVTGLEHQVSTLKKHVSGLSDKLVSFDSSFAKSKAKGNERNKKIKSFTKSLDNMHAEVAHLSAALNQAIMLEAEKDEEILRLKETPPVFASFFHGYLPLVARTDYAFLNKISEHASEPLSVILQLEPEKLARPANVPTSRDARVSHPITKESSNEFSRVQGELLSLAVNAGFERGLTRPANVPTSRDARVSHPITKESTVTPASKSLELSTNTYLTSSVVASEHNEEMVNAEKGDGLVPSFAVGEDAAANPSGV
nr:hypothetical protein [Tanacetum cinerariifolium]